MEVNAIVDLSAIAFFALSAAAWIMFWIWHAALTICRKNDWPVSYMGRMLPGWMSFSTLVSFAKWGALGVIIYHGKYGDAALVFAIAWVVESMLPKPLRFAAQVILTKVSSDIELAVLAPEVIVAARSHLQQQ